MGNFSKIIKIAEDIFIGNDFPTFIIAEAGINHNGDLSLALKLIDEAKRCKASAVKFQYFKAEKLYKISDPMFNFFKKVELKEKDVISLIEHARDLKIECFFSVFDLEGIRFLSELGVKIFKIASSDLTFLPLIFKLIKKAKVIFLSTGMSEFVEIEEILRIFERENFKNLILLYCVSLYPPEPKDINLNFLEILRKKFNVICGFSDHYPENIFSLASILKGAKVIEKHFTLDKNLEGPDHKISADPKQFKKLIEDIRKIEIALKEKKSERENKLKRYARRGMYAKEDISEGEILSLNKFDFLRPQLDGIDPLEFFKMKNPKAKKCIRKGSLLKKEDIK